MKRSESNGISRRRFAMAGLSAGGSWLALPSFFAEGVQPISCKADSPDLPAIKPRTNTSFASLKQIEAGLLNVGYAEDARQMVPRSSFSWAGPTIFTATSMLLRCWPRKGTE